MLPFFYHPGISFCIIPVSRVLFLMFNYKSIDIGLITTHCWNATERLWAFWLVCSVWNIIKYLLNSITNLRSHYPAMAFNTLRLRQNGRHFADDTFKRIFLNENIRIWIKISLKFVPKVLINNIPVLVQIMAWRRSGDKPLSEPMMVSFPTHICLTRPQWVNSVFDTLNIIVQTVSSVSYLIMTWHLQDLGIIGHDTDHLSLSWLLLLVNPNSTPSPCILKDILVS